VIAVTVEAPHQNVLGGAFQLPMDTPVL
jgi:hypothetical protein